MDPRTHRYFEDHAARFDSLYHEGRPLHRAFNRVFRKAIYERFAITFERSAPIAGRSVLDVGCGSGRYAIEYARRGAARVVGLDYSENMLTLARQLAQAGGVADCCEFVHGDFADFRSDEPFDLSIAIGVFDYQPRPVEFLRHMAEVTRSRVIGTFPGRSTIRMPLRKFRYWMSDCPVLFYREAEVRAIAHAAGFARCEIVPIHSSGTGFVLVADR
jgi:ubiquinone/menaquinone biosynthesis C-methylase UbiE